MHRLRQALLGPLAAALVLAGAAACSGDGREMTPPTSGQDLSIIDTTTTALAPVTTAPALVTPAFAVTMPWPEAGPIDARFTCTGTDVSPSLSWTAAPAGTAEFALVVRDRDADGAVHWLVTGIAGGTGTAPEGSAPEGAVVHTNAFGTVGWDGPCPPSGTHTYEFTVYALPEPLGLQPTLPAAETLATLEQSAIGIATGTGTFTVP